MFKRSCLPQLVGWLVCQFIAQMSKPRKSANPGVNLYSCHLLTFIHFHLFFIHLYSLSIFIHSCKHSSKCSYINNVHSYILSQPGRHIGLCSQFKRITVSHFKRLKEKIKKKAEFTPKLAPCDPRKKERMNE